jgi:hypothetical protein
MILLFPRFAANAPQLHDKQRGGVCGCGFLREEGRSEMGVGSFTLSPFPSFPKAESLKPKA